MYLLIYLCMCIHPCAMWKAWDSLGEWFSPSIVWVFGIELRLSGLVASTFTQGAIVLVLAVRISKGRDFQPEETRA